MVVPHAPHHGGGPYKPLPYPQPPPYHHPNAVAYSPYAAKLGPIVAPRYPRHYNPHYNPSRRSYYA